MGEAGRGENMKGHAGSSLIIRIYGDIICVTHIANIKCFTSFRPVVSLSLSRVMYKSEI